MHIFGERLRMWQRSFINKKLTNLTHVLLLLRLTILYSKYVLLIIPIVVIVVSRIHEDEKPDKNADEGDDCNNDASPDIPLAQFTSLKTQHCPNAAGQQVLK
jgi:hypothetical protein